MLRGVARAAAPRSRFVRRVYASSASHPPDSPVSPRANQPPETEPPPLSTLWKHFVACAVPMVGFGIMDNSIMIHAGDLIDNFFGNFLKFTLVAAAFGQLFSDVAGVLFGGTVDMLAVKLGLPQPQMSDAQRTHRTTKFVGTFGSALGVMVGCALGMINLLFLDLAKADRMKKAEGMRTLFETIMAEGWVLLNCDRCTLYLLQDITKDPAINTRPEDAKTLFTMVKHGAHPTADELAEAFKFATGKDPNEKPTITTEQLAHVLQLTGWEAKNIANMLPERDELTFEDYQEFMRRHLVEEQCTVPLRPGGTKWYVVTTGDILNIPDVYRDERFKDNRFQDRYSGYVTRSLLIGPVKDENGKVIGLIEMINKFKLDENGSSPEHGLEITSFDKNDERLLQLLCAHCSNFISHSGCLSV